MDADSDMDSDTDRIIAGERQRGEHNLVSF